MRGESTLGADKDAEYGIIFRFRMTPEEIADASHLFPLPGEQCDSARSLACFNETDGTMQKRQLSPPGLFRSFGDYASPAAEPFAIRFACHTALADYRHKAGDADFRTFLKNKLEIAPLEQRLIQGDFRARLSNRQGFTDYPSFNFAAVYFLELYIVFPATIIESSDMVTGSQTEYIAHLVSQLPGNNYRALGHPIRRQEKAMHAQSTPGLFQGRVL
jgi:hypothetical protein